MQEQPAREILDILVELQRVDNRLGELDISKIFLPKMLEDHRRAISDLEERLKELEAENISLKKSIDTTEVDIKEAKEQQQNSEKRLLQVKTNREYDAVQSEISHYEEKIAKKEEKLLKEMEELDVVQAELKEILEKYGKVKVESEKSINDIKDKLANLEEKIKSVQHEWKMLADKVPKKILATYSRIRGGKDGLAIVKVRKRACGGCFKSLPPQTIQELKRGETIINCESCGRFLTWDEEVSP